MDARPQRISRVRDENDLMAPIPQHFGERKALVSKASIAGQRLEQPAKRVALADATRHGSSLLNKGQETVATTKGGLSKPAVRPRPLGAKSAKSAASVATGTKNRQSRAERPEVYRDEPKVQKDEAAKRGNQGARKRPFVFRDEQPEANITENNDVAMGNTREAENVRPKITKVSPPVQAVELPPACNTQPAPLVVDSKLGEEFISPNQYMIDMENAAEELEVEEPYIDSDDEDDVKEDKTSRFSGHCSDPIEGPTVTGLKANRLYPETNKFVEMEISAAHEAFKNVKDDDEDLDPLMVSEYSEEILQHCHAMDHVYLPDPQYMNNQPHLEWSMRSTLIDWMVQVHERFRMVPETLYIAVNIVDRFLTKKAIPVSQLQLVGIVAIMIAAKIEEITPPSFDGLIYMVDGAYDAEEMRHCERYIMMALDYQLTYPGPMNFLRRLSRADHFDSEIRTLAKFFIETTIMDERFVGAPMSFVVAASYYLAMIMLNKGEWTQAHVHYGQYTSEQLGKAVEILVETCGLPHTHHPAIFEKYNEKQYRRVAFFVERWMVCQFGIVQS